MRIVSAVLAIAIPLNCAFAQTSPAIAPDQPTEQRQRPSTKEILTDAAIIALIIAASVTTYHATGKPCACPSDTMRNGRACGGNSAWAKPRGYKPLCVPTDITAEMIAAYRAAKSVPKIK